MSPRYRHYSPSYDRPDNRYDRPDNRWMQRSDPPQQAQIQAAHDPFVGVQMRSGRNGNQLALQVNNRFPDNYNNYGPTAPPANYYQASSISINTPTGSGYYQTNIQITTRYVDNSYEKRPKKRGGRGRKWNYPY